MRAYSVDIRERIIKRWQDGQSKAEIGRALDMSLSTVKRCISQYQQTGSVVGKVRKPRHKAIDNEQQAALVAQLQAHHDYTLEQHRQAWAAQQKVLVSVATLWRAIDAVGWTYKKRHWVPKNEMNRSERHFER
jgi:transposase